MFIYRCLNHFIILWTILLLGCTSVVKPNNPISGPYPVPLEKLIEENKTLSLELCRLPEIQDGISRSEIDALGRFYKMYIKNKALCDAVFESMYETGKANVRRYCTPLQALFWLVHDNKFSNYKQLLETYSLEALLFEAWNFEPNNKMSENDIETIINEMKNEKIQAEYQSAYLKHGAERVQKFILYDFGRKPGWFSSKARNIIETAQASAMEKWGDFDIVTDRLNSPRIIDHYVKRRIQYQDWRSIPGAVPDHPNVHYVFKYNKGDCEYISAFVVHCLKKAGYEAYLYRKSTPHGRWPWHVVAVFKADNGEKMVLDDGMPNPYKVGIVPFETYQ